jgi:large subunit ribosomal protein L29
MAKAQELRDASVGDLQQRALQMDDELFRLRMQKAMGQLEGAGKIRTIRRDLARVKTVIRELQSTK